MVISIIFFILGAIASWYVTHKYYQRSKMDLENINKNLENRIRDLASELRSISSNNKLARYEERIKMAIEGRNQKSTPKYVIDSFDDLSQKEKEEMFDAVYERTEGTLNDG